MSDSPAPQSDQEEAPSYLKSKNLWKIGFVLQTILILLFVALLFFSKYDNFSTNRLVKDQSGDEKPISYDNWTTYKNEDLQLSFQHPSSWNVIYDEEYTVPKGIVMSEESVIIVEGDGFKLMVMNSFPYTPNPEDLTAKTSIFKYLANALEEDIRRCEDVDQCLPIVPGIVTDYLEDAEFFNETMHVSGIPPVRIEESFALREEDRADEEYLVLLDGEPFWIVVYPPEEKPLYIDNKIVESNPAYTILESMSFRRTE